MGPTFEAFISYEQMVRGAVTAFLFKMEYKKEKSRMLLLPGEAAKRHAAEAVHQAISDEEDERTTKFIAAASHMEVNAGSADMLTALRDYVSVCERLQDRIAIQ